MATTIILSTIPVNAATCSYSFDKNAIAYGTVNRSGNVCTYNAYLIGSNANAITKGKYSVGTGGKGSTNITKVKALVKGIQPGKKKTTSKTVTVTIYNGSIAKTSAKA